MSRKSRFTRFMDLHPLECVDLLTVIEVAELLRTDPRLRGVVTKCALPAVLIDDVWRIHRDDVEAWIERFSEFALPDGTASA